MDPITTKQSALIFKLTEQLHGPDSDQAAALREQAHQMTKSDASRLISKLLREANAAPPATAPTPRTAQGVTPGLYRRDGRVVRVYVSRGGSGHLLASQYAEGEWTYLGAAGRFVRAEDRMSLEEVQAFGRDTGICGICGRTLTNPESVEAGVGPVCAGKA